MAHAPKDFDLHHVHPEWYDTLEPQYFKLLDTKCHEFVEWMAIRVATDKDNRIHGKQVMLSWLKDFLPKIERTVDKYMVPRYNSLITSGNEGKEKEANMPDWNKPKSTWEAPPIKPFNGKVIGVYDIGTQDGYQGADPKHQLVFQYELVSTNTKTSEGKNFQIAEFLTVSTHSKATTMARIQAITGIQFKPGKADKNGGFFYEVPEDLDEIIYSRVLGAPVLINLAAKPDGTPKVATVSQPMEGTVVGEPEGKIQGLNGAWDIEKYNKALEESPDWIRKLVAKSHEMRVPQANSAPKAPGQLPGQASPDGHVDDIPF